MVVRDLSFKINDRKFELKVRECKSFLSKASGLMFRKKSIPLLFIFDSRNRSAIHSLFCVPFIAIWFDGDEIVDVKLIDYIGFFIKPSRRFDKLLEVPLNNGDFDEIVDEIRKL
ncbi:hypothetical protein CMI42_01735 [Candidatus Pacearchaeota archaeon]|nr:hypothetical protein [Candidatus Pacearchaeota archaeon]